MSQSGEGRGGPAVGPWAELCHMPRSWDPASATAEMVLAL